tara:strand:+ start:17682 stop:18527 length:846 start_codon:yes stop_codon:yes gene_type:complete
MKQMILKTVALLLFLASITVQGQSGNTNGIPYGNNPKAGKYVDAGDAKMYYEVYGKGEPIILLHGGIMGSIGEMSGFIEKLQIDHMVIAMATRGHGRSEIGTEKITYELKANDVLAVIDAVTKDSITILGFSDGAYTAYKVASMYPDRVKKLVAIGAGEQIPGLREVPAFTAQGFDLNSDFWEARLALMPEPEKLEEFWRQMTHFYNTMVASKELFNSIQCPVLVLAGELDRNAPLATVIAAYQMIPDSQLGIVPNTGHVVFMENFEAVWASVEPFLKSQK